ncbi:hypothetical protein [Paenibacillus sp. FSL H3-0469]|uniref:hypothetical protein n=1 Tax=Paenibacillus sp. FSL H3-0469 TaxID=2954506 RepID=UPI003100D8B6
MLGAIEILMVSSLISLYEIPQLIQDKRKMDLIMFSLILAIATGLSIALALNIPVPNPVDWLRPIFDPVGQSVDNLLK